MTILNRMLPWVLLLKSVDVAIYGSVQLENQLLTALFTGGLVVAALVWFRQPRAGAALAALLFVALTAGPLYRNHVVFLAWVTGLTALSSDEREQRLLLTVHLSVVYAFATIVKLTPVWLSGEALGSRPVISLGVPIVVLAWATVIVEGLLAVAAWRPNRWWFALAVATHVGFILGMGYTVMEFYGLIIFSLATLGVWAALLQARSDAPDEPVLAPLSQPSAAIRARSV